MQLARVIGTVVATVKNESLEGRKLLVIQTLDKDLAAAGKPMVAIDSVGAGVGELVFWCRGKEAANRSSYQRRWYRYQRLRGGRRYGRCGLS